VQFRDVIYVSHVFHKQSKSGIATPMKEIDLVERRLAEVRRDYRGRQN
jgi:phage-related protein